MDFLSSHAVFVCSFLKPLGHYIAPLPMDCPANDSSALPKIRVGLRFKTPHHTPT